MHQLIKSNTAKINALCKKHKVKSLYAFGSVLRKDFNQESDVDLIVDFLPLEALEYTENYYDLKFSLQEMFHREVDLLEQKTLKNPYFIENINKNKELIYEC